MHERKKDRKIIHVSHVWCLHPSQTQTHTHTFVYCPDRPVSDVVINERRLSTRSSTVGRPSSVNVGCTFPFFCSLMCVRIGPRSGGYIIGVRWSFFFLIYFGGILLLIGGRARDALRMALSLTVHRTLPVRQDMQRSANLHRPRERQQWAHLKTLGFVRKRLGFDTVFHVLEA